jgi:hypothetical protein
VCLSGFQFPFSFQLRRVSKKPSAARSIAFRVLYRASQALDAGSIPAARSRLVSYAPQIEILKRSSLCITHAGLNTVLESLSSGVPMVALPITNDQPGVAARIADKKVGVVISPDQASPGNFVAAITGCSEIPRSGTTFRECRKQSGARTVSRLPQVFLKQHLNWKRVSKGWPKIASKALLPNASSWHRRT